MTKTDGPARRPNYTCPICGTRLTYTETDGLWCPAGCYDSEYSLWTQLMSEHKVDDEAER